MIWPGLLSSVVERVTCTSRRHDRMICYDEGSRSNRLVGIYFFHIFFHTRRYFPTANQVRFQRYILLYYNSNIQSLSCHAARRIVMIIYHWLNGFGNVCEYRKISPFTNPKYMLFHLHYNCLGKLHCPNVLQYIRSQVIHGTPY